MEPMESLLSKEDLKIVLGEVRRFARGVVAANVERPEHPLARPSLEMLVAEATEAGFIPGGRRRADWTLGRPR